MDCIYNVTEHFGNYEGWTSSKERACKEGKAKPFYRDGIALVDYEVKRLDDGFLLGFTVRTRGGEIVALQRWTGRHDSEYTASQDVIEAACSAARQYDSTAVCLVGEKLADDVLAALKAQETKRIKETEATDIGKEEQ